MSIITTEELKTYLGVDDATQDELLSIFAN